MVEIDKNKTHRTRPWLLLSLLLVSGCLTRYRDYDYHIDRYAGEIWGVNVDFKGDQFTTDWREKAEMAATRMMRQELDAHGLPHERIIVTELAPMEGGGIYAYGFAGTATTLDGLTLTQLQMLVPEQYKGINIRQPHPYRAPFARGSGKLPPTN